MLLCSNIFGGIDSAIANDGRDKCANVLRCLSTFAFWQTLYNSRPGYARTFRCGYLQNPTASFFTTAMMPRSICETLSCTFWGQYHRNHKILHWHCLWSFECASIYNAMVKCIFIVTQIISKDIISHCHTAVSILMHFYWLLSLTYTFIHLHVAEHEL